MTSNQISNRNLTTDQKSEPPAPPKGTVGRGLADDLKEHPSVDSILPSAEAFVTPGKFLIRRFPGLAEKHGVPLVERINGKGEKRTLKITGLEEGFFAACLGFDGNPESPFVYDHVTGKFFHYNGGYFRETTSEIITDKLREILLDAERSCTDPDLDRSGLVKLRGQRSLNPVVQAAMGKLLVNDDFWIRDHTVFPCQNGVVTWENESWVLKPHSPNYHFRGLLGAKFDPRAKCPRFLEILKRALPLDDINLLQRILGNLLIGKNRAQKFTIFLGSPQSGKGVIVRIVIEILGSENVTTLRTVSLEGRFEIGRMMHKLLVYAPDVSDRFLQ